MSLFSSDGGAASDLLALSRIIQGDERSAEAASAIVTPATIVREGEDRTNSKKDDDQITKTPNDDIWSDSEIQDENDTDDAYDSRERPRFDILYKQNVTSEDTFLGMSGKNTSTASCNYIVVRIDLPGAKSKDIKLDVTSSRLVAESQKYRLVLSLPHRVRDKEGKAKWDSKKERLSVTLPIVR